MVIVVRGQVWSNPSIFLLWPSRWNNGVWNCDLELMCLCCNGSKIHSQLVTRKVRACHGWEKRWLLGSIARLCIEQHSDQLTIFRLKKKMSDTIVTSLKLLINRLCSDSTICKICGEVKKGPFFLKLHYKMMHEKEMLNDLQKIGTSINIDTAGNYRVPQLCCMLPFRIKSNPFRLYQHHGFKMHWFWIISSWTVKNGIRTPWTYF